MVITRLIMENYIYYKEKDNKGNIDVIAGFWQYS